MFSAGVELNGRYRIVRLIGQGGMASVFEAEHLNLPLRVALKIITARLENDPQFLSRFRREAKMLAGLKHPNIVSITDWDSYEGQPYLVMELLDGEDLSQSLRKDGPPEPATALDLFKQIGDALGVAHASGIIHRDLKPANLFLYQPAASQPVQVKVLDFGLARPILPPFDEFRTQGSLVAGTPPYMSPEQANAEKDLDARSDQFSLAAILYELLVGRKAFARSGDAIPAILLRVTQEHPPPLPWPQLDSAIRRALAKKRDDRYRSVQAFVDAVLSAGQKELSGASPDVMRPAAQSGPRSNIGRTPSSLPPASVSRENIIAETMSQTNLPLSRSRRRKFGVLVMALVAAFLLLMLWRRRVETSEMPQPTAAAQPHAEALSRAARPNVTNPTPERQAPEILSPALLSERPPAQATRPVSAARRSAPPVLELSGISEPSVGIIRRCFKDAVGNKAKSLPPMDVNMAGDARDGLEFTPGLDRRFLLEYRHKLRDCLQRNKQRGLPAKVRLRINGGGR